MKVCHLSCSHLQHTFQLSIHLHCDAYPDVVYIPVSTCLHGILVRALTNVSKSDWISNPFWLFWVHSRILFLLDMPGIPPQGGITGGIMLDPFKDQMPDHLSWLLLMRRSEGAPEQRLCIHDLDDQSFTRLCSSAWLQVRTWSHWSVMNFAFRLSSLFIHSSSLFQPGEPYGCCGNVRNVRNWSVPQQERIRLVETMT